MKNLNHLSIDGRSLRVFLTVIEEQSVSLAARKLGITQSAVSHTLDRLRELLDDPLFIRAGRGITSTQYANSITDDVRFILARMQTLVNSHCFDPSKAELVFTIAASDFQRDLILSQFYPLIRQQTKSFHLRVIATDLPVVNLLRFHKADLVLGLAPPPCNDILQKRLLTDQRYCFYDPNTRTAPQLDEDYYTAEYISTTYSERFTLSNQHASYEPNIVLRMANFGGIAKFLKGTPMLAIAPSLLQHNILADFAATALPFQIPSVNIYMLWHQRHQSDPTHRWLRNQITAIANQVQKMYLLP